MCGSHFYVDILGYIILRPDIVSDIMNPSGFHTQLRDARQAKNWSQRELSERAGMPQAHISRIESGAVDPKVSTLQQLARLLDLELALVPRTALTAVGALVRESRGDAERRLLSGIVQRMHRAADTLQGMAGGLNDRVAEAADDLASLDPADVPGWVRADIVTAAQTVDEAVKAHDARAIDVAIQGLWPVLKDALALVGKTQDRPAYTLDDEA